MYTYICTNSPMHNVHYILKNPLTWIKIQEDSHSNICTYELKSTMWLICFSLFSICSRLCAYTQTRTSMLRLYAHPNPNPNPNPNCWVYVHHKTLTLTQTLTLTLKKNVQDIARIKNTHIWFRISPQYLLLQDAWSHSLQILHQ